ncbi:MAG: transglycosylase domain-containing protein, partial [Deltaproteobacteria bacterium]|nr:transglycosylase domain-containing protein [Deltaproteobacteria bacterium]
MPAGQENSHPAGSLKKRRRRIRLLGVLLLGGAAGLFLFWSLLGLASDPLSSARFPETTVVADRHNQILTRLPPPGGYRQSLRLDQFSPHLLAAVVAAEDRRFYYHP